MGPKETIDDSGGAQTDRVASLRDHLEDHEFLEFSNNLVDGRARQQMMDHLDACSRCRQVLTELHRDEEGTKRVHTLLGQMLGEYRVDAPLSRGGMGAVYRGVQPLIGKQVAIKVLLPEALGDPERMHRLLVEARAVNSVRHPNIIDIFSFGELPDGRHYFVMELLDGQTLDELLDEKGALTAEQVLTVLEQTASALSAAHGAGVVHRDLKPANVFVSVLPDKRWHVTVLDFGLAKQLNSKSPQATAPDIVMGTPGYMAPEQIRGEAVSERTDLYSLGLMAWVLLAGEQPFEKTTPLDLMWRHLEDPLPSLARKAPAAPHSLVRLIEKMAEKRPEDRPRSANDVVLEVQRIRKDLDGYQSIKTPGPVIPAEQLIKPENRAIAATVPAGNSAVPRREALEDKATRLTRKPAITEVETPAAQRPAKRAPLGPIMGVSVVIVGLLAFAGWRLSSSDESTPPVALPTEVTPEPVAAPDPPPPPEPTAAPEPPTPEPPAPEPAVEAPTPKPKVPAITQATVTKRFGQARGKAAKLENAAARRMMTLDLDRLEDRLKKGEAPRTVNRELDDILEKYGAP